MNGSDVYITSFRSITMFCRTNNICGIFPIFTSNMRIFYRILSVPHNTVMDLYNVMKITLQMNLEDTLTLLHLIQVSYKIVTWCGSTSFSIFVLYEWSYVGTYNVLHIPFTVLHKHFIEDSQKRYYFLDLDFSHYYFGPLLYRHSMILLVNGTFHVPVSFLSPQCSKPRTWIRYMLK